MTRDDLIRELVDKQGHVPYKDMCVAIKHLLNCMVNSLSTGKRIEIRGFGSFALRYRPARLARNPKTGAILSTAAKYSVHFKPGLVLKERVNNAAKELA